MADEGFEEWDADFLDQLIKVEEQTLSSLNPTQSLFRQPPPPPPAQPAIPPPPPPNFDSYFTHSPPRELSQRTTVSAHSSNQASHGLSSRSHSSFPLREPKQIEIDNSRSHSSLPLTEPKQIEIDNSRSSGGSHSSFPIGESKQIEIDRLKNELGRVSKQLLDLERECSDLRKERDGKEEKLRSVFSRNESKEAGVEYMTELKLEDGVHMPEHSINRHGCGNTNSSNDHVGAQINAGAFIRKEVGVQTEKPAEPNDPMIEKNLSTTRQCSRKLFAIWDPPSGQHSRRNLVPKLLVACESDLQVLFGCLSSNPSLNTKLDHPTYGSAFDVHLNHQVHPVQSAEAAKVSHLYLMLTKIGYDMVKLKDLVEALVDLCGLENVIIVHKSLRVLRVLLNHVFRMEKTSNRRDNVIVEVNNKTINPKESRCSEPGSLFYENATETSQRCHVPCETRFKYSANICEDEVVNDGSLLSVSGAECFSLFEQMHQIVMRNIIEHVRLEAVSIMNMILMRTNAYVEREKFGQLLAFQSISQLLRKEVGIAVQKQAVHLLYLLLNSPTLMANFCSEYKEEGMIEDTANGVRPAPAVLDGLADCLTCNGNSGHVILELKLQRNAIILLAFLASSGKFGFEIVLGHRLPKRFNLLTLILQILASEDSKASESIQQDDVSKERTFLIREALIFLNRLVSNPQYSASVLRALTNTRDSASLTIDVANRFSRKGKWLWQSDTMASQMRESEVVDLGRVFKKRVFTFLGDSIP